MLRFAVLLALASSPIAAWAQVAPDVKVVFLRGTALMTANTDGSNVKQLLDDGIAKAQPRWSPAGDKIVYQIAGQKTKDPKIHANLVIVTATGVQLSTIPVFASEPDGTVIAGMRFVESSGWFGNDAVFAEGSANPYIGEYRKIDIHSGLVLQYYEGTSFATCESQAKVAYELRTRYKSNDPAARLGYELDVNGTAIYSNQPPPGVQEFGIGDLHWFAGCTHLVFIENSDAIDTLVILSGATVEAKIPFPASVQWPLKFDPIGISLMIRSSSGGALFYGTTNHMLRPAPDILQQLQQRENAEAQVMKTLGGQSPDWYRPSR